MTRQIDLDNLTPDDLQYFNERPWLKAEYEMQTGNKFDDLDFGVEQEVPADPNNVRRSGEANVVDDYPSYSEKPRPDGWENYTDDEKRSYVYRGELPDGSYLEGFEPDGGDSDGMEEVSGKDAGTEEEGEDKPYSEWEYQDLKDEVAERELEVENQKAATLIAALEADDEADSE